MHHAELNTYLTIVKQIKTTWTSVLWGTYVSSQANMVIILILDKTMHSRHISIYTYIYIYIYTCVDGWPPKQGPILINGN